MLKVPEGPDKNVTLLATLKSHRLKINPGGMVSCADLRKTNISSDHRNRLLSVKEAEDLGLISRLAVPVCHKCQKNLRGESK